MSSITYLAGDATKPQGDGKKIIAHVCNDVGAWGAGFVVPLGQRYPIAKTSYLAKVKWGFLRLPSVDYNLVAGAVSVCSMIAQRGIGPDENGVPPIRYDALERCMEIVCDFALDMDASVHLPRIGCGLAGGTWDRVEPIILGTLCANNIPVFVYDLPKGCN